MHSTTLSPSWWRRAITRSARSPLTTVMALALIASHGLAHADDEEAEIVTNCYYANGEWGAAMIDVCVKENQALRAEVLAYPDEHRVVVERCRKRSPLGWKFVKNCVDQDIAAASALAAYPANSAELIETCKFDHRGQGAAMIKSCVDKLISGKSTPTQN